MKHEWRPAPKGEEAKERIPAWLYPSTLETIDKLVKENNCKSRSDFLETAAQFYAGYLSGQEATAYLPPALVAAMRGTVQDSENRLARMDFKIAVELSKLSQVIAYTHDVDEEAMKRLHTKCVEEVRRINGAIDFEDAYKYQKRET